MCGMDRSSGKEAIESSGHTHRTTNADRVIGNEPRIIEEFAGWMDLDKPPVRVVYVYMRHPCGSVERGHTPEFEDSTVALQCTISVEIRR